MPGFSPGDAPIGTSRMSSNVFLGENHSNVRKEVTPSICVNFLYESSIVGSHESMKLLATNLWINVVLPTCACSWKMRQLTEQYQKSPRFLCPYSLNRAYACSVLLPFTRKNLVKFNSEFFITK